MVIVDSHAHMDVPLPGILPDPKRKKVTHLLMWGYEILGYRNPLPKGDPPEIARIIIAMENQLRISRGTRENLLYFMDKYGIDRTVVLPIAPYVSSLEYLEMCRDEPRLIPFASAYPSENWQSDLRKAMEGGCRGLKIHPILQRLAPEDPFYFDLLEEFRQYGRPVIAHTGEFSYFITKDDCSPYGDTRRLEGLIKAFPDVPFVLAHMGLVYYPERAIELARRYESVYLDTSFQPLKMVREALRVAGRDRVMFGSDWPEGNQNYPLRIARKATEGDEILREKLLGGNILALVE